MGRTAPPPRVAVERELARLKQVAGALRDPGDRGVLERLLDCAYRALDAYKHVDMPDPLEPVLLGMMLCLARAVEGACREYSSTQGRREAVGSSLH